MKRIGIFLQPAPYYGGTFQYCTAVLEAAASLPKDRFEIVVAFTNPIWGDYLKDYDFKKIAIPYVLPGITGRTLGKIGFILDALQQKHFLPVTFWRHIAHYFHPLAKMLVDQECHLWIFPSQDEWSYQVKVPALATIHDLMHRYQGQFPEVSANGEYERREKLYSNMCKSTKGLLVDSELGRQQVYESYNVPKTRIFVLPFIPPRHVFEDKVSSDFNDKYRLPEKFVFYPAQFWVHKNHIRLVQAIDMLKENIRDIHLVLVGSQEKNGYQGVRRLVEQLNLESAVHFMGYVSDNDIPEFYRRARALIFPTFFGPTNIPPLEAFALGCPVACSNIFGMPEQVGDAALLFNPESVEEIAESIRRLWVDDQLCEELVRRGRQHAAAWGQVQFNQRLLDIIEQVA